MEKLSALGTAAGGARSYSDFMRSLAAKYNNNEYFTPTTAGSSPPQASATKQDIFPFLGLGAFPQADALDLTEKRVKTEGDGSPSTPPSPPRSSPPPSPSQRVELNGEPNEWTVEQVATFVMDIDICREYGQVFRDNKIDGGCLPLLTESHLTTGLGLKLGPALKLLTALRKRLGPEATGCVKCAHCHHLPSPAPPPPPASTSSPADQEAEVSV